MASLAKRMIAALVAEQSPSILLDMGDMKHLFREHEVPLYDFVLGFAKQYGALPGLDTISAHTQEIIEIPGKLEPVAYYRDLLSQRYMEDQVKAAAKKAMDKLDPANKDPEGALEILTAMCMGVIQNQQKTMIRDFRDAYDYVIPDYVQKLSGDHSSNIRFGWPTLDNMLGGIGKGDLISLVGRPAQGKTWFLLWMALHAFLQQKKRILFVSMEMAPLPIMQRLASVTAHVPVGKLMKAGLDTKHYTKLKKGLTELKGMDNPFWVADGNLAATVEDIYAMARTLKPDEILIDGGYLVKHPTERDRYKRVAENADLVKQELASICPTVVSWQFARSAAKKNKKKGEKEGLEDIGYTDAIGQVSSLVAGLLQQESAETIQYREVDILKGRNGEIGSFKVNWNFDKMDFAEYTELEVEELQFA